MLCLDVCTSLVQYMKGLLSNPTLNEGEDNQNVYLYQLFKAKSFKYILTYFNIYIGLILKMGGVNHFPSAV